MKITMHSVFRVSLVTLGLLLSVGVNAADFTMKVAAPVAPSNDDIIYSWMSTFESNVEKTSNGQIDVQLYPAGQLGKMPATLQGAAMGTIEVSIALIGNIAALDSRFGVLDAGGLFESEAHAVRTLKDPKVRELLSEFGASANLEPLAVMPSGQSVLVANRAIDDISDFEGLKLRTGGAAPMLNKLLKEIGASPVNLPLGEVLPAIQTRAIDGTVLNMSVLNSFQFQDVATEATYVPGSFIIVGAVVSKDFLQAIGPELESVVREQATESLSVYDDYLKNRVAQMEEVWKKNGGKLRHLDDKESEAYLSKMAPIVEDAVARDSQLHSDYEALKAAAKRNL